MSAPDIGTGYAAAIVAKAENLEVQCWELPKLV
jgi:hypothetical protein